MDNKELKVEIGIGLNQFKFGITRDVLKEAVGAPDEVEENDEGLDGEGKIEVWHYDEYELSVEFIEGNDWHLSTIAVNSDKCLLQSVPVIGKPMNEVLNLIDVLNLGEYESEKLDLDDEHDITLVSAFESGVNFWFEGGVLTELQLTPIEEE